MRVSHNVIDRGKYPNIAAISRFDKGGLCATKSACRFGEGLYLMRAHVLMQSRWGVHGSEAAGVAEL